MESIFAVSALRRVGREGAAQDLGHREERKQQRDEAEDETPHDIIELTSLHAGELPPVTDRAVTTIRPPLPTRAAAVLALPERHLDLEV